MHEVNEEELCIDGSEYGTIIRAIVEATEAYLLRSGVRDNVAAAVAEHLFARARRLYVDSWMRQALEDDLDDGRGVDEQSEALSARRAFDRAVGRQGSPFILDPHA